MPPLTDEDRLTLVRWIDLGCPIDLDYDPANPERRGYGWMLDDKRPTLTLTYPQAGANAALTRLLVGMYDAYTGLDMDTFSVTADFALAETTAGDNLAAKFKPLSPGVWELKLDRPITDLKEGKLTVSVKDRQGNVSVVERTFSVGRRPGGQDRGMGLLPYDGLASRRAAEAPPGESSPSRGKTASNEAESRRRRSLHWEAPPSPRRRS